MLFGPFRSLVHNGASVFVITDFNRNRPDYVGFCLRLFVEYLFDRAALKCFKVFVDC